MKATRTRMVAAILGCLALVLAGCGSDDHDPAPSTSQSQPPSGKQTPDADPVDGDRCPDNVYSSDGAVDLLILAGDVDCEQASTAAKKYMSDLDGFVTNTPMDVGDGWTCYPSPGEKGEIARCVNGDQEVSLNSRHHAQTR